MVSKREKAFNTACQEEVYRQVKSYLDELVDEHFDDAEHCDFYLKYGSTVLEISIDPYQEDDAVIEVLAFCVQGVEPSFELMQELLRVNAEVPLGAFSMVGGDIFYSHSFLGRRVPPEQRDSPCIRRQPHDEPAIRRPRGSSSRVDPRRHQPREYQ